MDLEVVGTIIKVLIVIIAASWLTMIFASAPFVPSSKKVIRLALEAIPLKDGMHLYDLGCGDARFLTEASKKANIIGEGYEITPMVWLIAKIRVWRSRRKNIHIHLNTYMKADLSKADAVFLYLLPKAVQKLTHKLKQEMKKGSLVLSHAFELEELKPQLIHTVPRTEDTARIFIYKM